MGPALKLIRKPLRQSASCRRERRIYGFSVASFGENSNQEYPWTFDLDRFLSLNELQMGRVKRKMYAR